MRTPRSRPCFGLAGRVALAAGVVVLGCAGAPAPQAGGGPRLVFYAGDPESLDHGKCAPPETVSLAREDLIAAMCHGDVCVFSEAEEVQFNAAVRSGREDVIKQAVAIRDRRVADLRGPCAKVPGSAGAGK
jgi:hypothetical protein